MTVVHERYQRVKEAFYRVCERPEHERAAVLADCCAGDAELEAQVRLLLDAGDRAGEFLARPVIDGTDLRHAAAAGMAAAGSGQSLPISIGRYTVLGLIGEGGMGAVYRAAQDAPRRSVAIKVVRAGMVTARLLRRFEHEVEALGRLDHPGIARIYEAGFAEVRWPGGGSGSQPYFAMELVEGVTLTRFAADRTPTIPERLVLLARICDAVHHGHQRGVIHRDLKPANILVCADGSPKIIDFGVARAAGDGGGTRTAPGQVLGTLAYMSPEQLGGGRGGEGRGDPVDTRADVYALGVIAYELLSGRLPVEPDGLSIAEAAGLIRLQEPAPLGALDRALRGDIQTVVARALEKEPGDRYPSASDLAADLRRILADEPVAARPATTLYTLRRFARRNRALAAGAGVALAGLVVGMGMATWQAVRATLQRNRAVHAEHAARAEAEAARRIARCLEAVFAAYDGAGGGWMGVGDLSPPTARAVLDRSAESIAQELADRPLEQAALLERIGRVYVGMGLHARGRAVLEAALNARRAAAGADTPETARILRDLAWACHVQNDDREAEAFQDRAIAVLRGTDDGQGLAEALCSAGDYLINQDRFAAALVRVEEAVRVWSVLPGKARELSSAYELLGQVRVRLGDLAGAREAFLAAGPDGEGPTASALPFALAHIERLLGNTEAAEGLEARAERSWADVADPLDLRAADTALAIAGVLSSHGRVDAAERFLRRAQGAMVALLGPESAATADATLRLATVLHEQGKLAGAATHYRAALQSFRRLAGDEHPDVGTCLFRLAQTTRDAGALALLSAEADRLRRGAESLPVGHPHRSGALLLVGYIALARGDSAGAEAPLRDCVSIRQATLAPGHRLTAYAQTVLGECLTAQGRLAEARAILPQAAARVLASSGPASVMAAEARSRLDGLNAALERRDRP